MKPGIKWGIIASIVSIIYSVIGMSAGLAFEWWFGLVSIVLYIVFVVMAVREAREQTTGDFSFGAAFGTGFQVVLISGVVGILFNLLYTTVINPNYYTQAAEIMATKLQQMGLPEDQVEASLEDIRNPNVIRNTAIGLVSSIIIGAIVAAIVAAIMKREEKIVG